MARDGSGGDLSNTVRAGWELLHLLQLGVSSLEDTATRVVAAQIAGVIGLWTQLGTFESGPPEILAWSAWGILLVSIVLLATLVSPRRLAEFWTRLVTSDVLVRDEPLALSDEAELIDRLSSALCRQRDRLERRLRISVALGVAGLTVAALAYVVEKALFAP